MIDTILGIYWPLLGVLGRVLVFPIGAIGWFMFEMSRGLRLIYLRADNFFIRLIDDQL